MTAEYIWTDNPTVNGVAECDTDVLNDCLMHLKYTKTIRNTGSTETSLIPLDDADIHLYNGSLLSGDGAYGDFVDFMAEKYEDVGSWQIEPSEPEQRLTDYAWSNLAYGNNLYMAVTRVGITNNIYVYYSADGISWTSSTWHLDNYYAQGLTYAGGKFWIFCTASSFNNYLYFTSSTDGITWTSLSSIQTEYERWVFNGSCGINRAGTRCIVYDGTSWQIVYFSNGITLGNSYFSGLCYGQNKYVAISADGYISISTTNSINTLTTAFKVDNLGGTQFNEWNICYNEEKNLFIALKNDTKASISRNGVDWILAKQYEALAGHDWGGGLIYENNNAFALSGDGYTSSINLVYDGIFTTEEDWQDCVNSSGQCGKFVWDSENDTLRLPKLDERVDDIFKSPVNNYVVVGTSVKQDIEVNLDKVATDLTGKADVDLSNVSGKSGFRKLTAIYNDGTDWYKVYSEYSTTTGEFIGKWCEQGGFLDTQATTSNIALLKPYKTSTYQISLTCKYTTNAYAPCVVTQSADSFQVYVTAVGYDVYWEAKGYIS